MLTFEAPSLEVSHDGGIFQGPAMFAVACNVSRFGGGMRIAPKARFDDGALDLVPSHRGPPSGHSGHPFRQRRRQDVPLWIWGVIGAGTLLALILAVVFLLSR